MAKYTLPDLPYDYAALEPHISGEIMQLHHDKHHQKYVDDANTAIEKLTAAREAGDFATVPMLEKNLAFNLGGHTNHSIFWTNMSPEGGGRPDGELGAATDEHFGSFEKMQGQFEAVATTIQGSGWAILAWDSIGDQLIIVQLYDQQANCPAGVVPLLMLDMWEHAFYLQYKNVKADYAKAWWNVVNWDDVNARFERARTATNGLLVAG